MLIKKKLLPHIFNKILEIKSQIKYFIDILIWTLVHLKVQIETGCDPIVKIEPQVM